MTGRSLTLNVDGYFVNQWDATCVVALEEKQLEYATARALLRDGGGVPAGLTTYTKIARVPALQHGDVWLTESSAIVEYLDDVFPDRTHLLPRDPAARGRARQLMAFLRSDLFDLRTERSWWMCVYPTSDLKPLSRNAERDARELVDIVQRLAASGELTHWNIAHADLALTVLRLARTGFPVPTVVDSFLAANLARASVRAYVEHPRPPHPPHERYAAG